MTAQVHTAIEFHARQFSSAAECIANARRLKRMFAPRREPQARVSDKPSLHLVEKIDAQQDEHVKAWRAFLRAANVTPIRFLRQRCIDLGFNYEEIVGQSQVKRLVDPRHQLMVEIKAAYPKLSMPHIGRMFGGRDHTVVRWAFIKAGLPMPKPVTLRAHAVEIKALLDQGWNYADIGRKLDYSFSAIQMFAFKRGWTKANHRTRVISDHAETVERMWREGAKFADIAEAIDFEPTSVSRFIRKRGWQRP